MASRTPTCALSKDGEWPSRLLKERLLDSGIGKKGKHEKKDKTAKEKGEVAPGTGPLVSGGFLCAVCCILDFCWTSPAMPKGADPDEAFAEAPGMFRVTRYLLLFFGALTTAMFGLTIMVAQTGLSLRKNAVMLLIVVNAALVVLVAISDFLAGNRFYAGPSWNGPYWIYTFIAAVMTCGLSVVALVEMSFPNAFRPDNMNDLLLPTKKKCCKDFLKRIPVICLGSVYVVLGLFLFCLGLFFYSVEPRNSMFGSLDHDLQSFLEFHTHGGETQLVGSSGKGVFAVKWGSTVGIQIRDLSTGVSLMQSVSSTSAFIVSSVVGSEKSKLKVKSAFELGTFTINDVPGSLSTEQVVEKVIISPKRNWVAFAGYLYYGPFLMTESPRPRMRSWDWLFFEGDEDEADVDTPWRSWFQFNISLEEAETGTMVAAFKLQVNETTNDRVYLLMKSESNERIFGLGESFSYMDLKGGVVPIITREQGIGRGLEPLSFLEGLALRGMACGTATQFTYSAIPHFLTSFLRSVSLTTTAFSVMDFSHDDRIVIEVNASLVEGHFIGAPHPIKLVQTYAHHISGLMRPLPDWTGKGAIVGLQGGKKNVAAKLSKLLNHGVPISAVWIQDWSGQRNTTFGSRLYWNWETNEDYYPGWFDWVEELFAKYRINVLSYINPYLAKGGPLFLEAQARDCLFLHNNKTFIQVSGSLDFRFATVDLSKEDCVEWYVKVIKDNMLGNGTTESRRRGVLGWMADFGESIPFDFVDPSFHNKFPELWAKVNRLAIQDDPFLSENVVFFTRSASVHTPEFTTLQWMGDQLTSWDKFDGLHSALIGQLSAGLSGISQAHSDIGGYTMISKFPLQYLRSVELFQRWAEYSCFADSVFRTHEGLLPDDSAQAWDDEVVGHFALFARIHSALWPMRKRISDEERGLPWMRSMWLHFSSDRNVTSLKSQFLAGGTGLLVCPTLFPGKNATSCYLPANRSFQHVFLKINFDALPHGRTVRCSAPIGSPCVLFDPSDEEASATVSNIRKIIADHPLGEIRT